MRPDQMRHPCLPPQPMTCPRTEVVAPGEPVEHLSRHKPPVAPWLRFVAQLWKSQNNWSHLGLSTALKMTVIALGTRFNKLVQFVDRLYWTSITSVGHNA